MGGTKDRLPTWPTILFLLVTLMTSSVTSLVFSVPLHTSSALTQKDVMEADDDVTSGGKNLEGRPGQGYYIAINMGEPPQQVSGR